MSLARIRAIVAADLLIRFRRGSTVVLFLLLGGSAYLWIPHPSSGWALIVIDGRRAIYNSAAIGMGTASLGTLFVGLFGFYFISNAFRRDARTRCGFVIASTPMRDIEYLAGKLFGNVCFISILMSGYFLTSVVMLLVRAEASLELGVFATQYLLLTPPAIVMVAVLAVVFESVPFLSGRFGDVAYFFVWIASLSIVALALAGGAPTALRYLDFSGVGFMVESIKESFGTTEFSIGGSSFDPAKPTVVFEGLALRPGWVLPRVTAVLLPLLLLPIALVSFHRFDPVRLRKSLTAARRSRLGRIHVWLKPATKALEMLRAGGREGELSLANLARQDAFVALSAFPAAGLAVLGFAVATSATPLDAMRGGVLPALFAALAVLVADISCREARAGTESLVWAAPLVERHFVVWKLLSALTVSALFVAIPFLRLLVSAPRSAVSLLVGTVLVCAAATCLGILTSNPKTFIVVFLSFWYVAVNDGGRAPALDFAGFHGTATTAVTAAYVGIAVAFLSAALVTHRARRRRD